LKFLSDVIVRRKFKNYFKGVKYKFTNLPLSLNFFLIMGYGIYIYIYFFRFELIIFFIIYNIHNYC